MRRSFSVKHLVDWYGDNAYKAPRPKPKMSPELDPLLAMLRRYDQLSEAETKAFDEAVRGWFFQIGRSFPDQQLAFVSAQNKLDNWAALNERISSLRTQDAMENLIGFLYWYRQRVGDLNPLTVEQVVKSRYLKPEARLRLASLRQSTGKSGSEPQGASLITLSKDEAIRTRLAKVGLSNGDEQSRAAYLAFLEIQPDPQLRPTVLAYLRLKEPQSPEAAGLQNLLLLRWANRSSEPLIAQAAQNVAGTRRVGGFDLNAESISKLCEFRSTYLRAVVDFWIKRRRWSFAVTKALASGGLFAERHLMEAAIRADLNDPPLGFANLMIALSKIGNERTYRFAQLMARLAENQKITSTSVLRYIDLVRYRSYRNVTANGGKL